MAPEIAAPIDESHPLGPMLIKKVRVSVQATGPHENHWVIYLLPVSHSTDFSIRANMCTMDYENSQGKLVWTTHRYQVAANAVRHWDFDVKFSHLTGERRNVASLAGVLHQLRHFIFSPGGSGCAFWV